MEQREYWNQVAGAKEFTTPFHMDIFEKSVSKSGIVLDVGCGYGRTLNQLYGKGYQNLIGVDFSEGMIERGKRQFPNLDLRVMPSDRIPLLDDSVNAVILFAVLTCIPSDSSQQALIQEIRRVLRPGGIIYVNDFLLNEDSRNLERYKQYESRYGVYGVFELPEGAVLRHHEESWIQKLLSVFSTLNYGKVIYTTMNGHTSNGFYYLGITQLK